MTNEFWNYDKYILNNQPHTAAVFHVKSRSDIVLRKSWQIVSYKMPSTLDQQIFDRLLLCFALGEGPDRKQMWRFFPVFIKIWFFDTQNTFYLIVRGLNKQ